MGYNERIILDLNIRSQVAQENRTLTRTLYPLKTIVVIIKIGRTKNPLAILSNTHHSIVLRNPTKRTLVYNYGHISKSRQMHKSQMSRKRHCTIASIFQTNVTRQTDRNYLFNNNAFGNARKFLNNFLCDV